MNKMGVKYLKIWGWVVLVGAPSLSLIRARAPALQATD